MKLRKKDLDTISKMISKMGSKSLEKFGEKVSLSAVEEDDKKRITDFIIKREKELAELISPMAENGELKRSEMG